MSDLTLWVLVTTGSLVIWFVVVMSALLMRAHENKIDVMAEILTSGMGEPEEAELEDIDTIVGISDESRLFHVHAHGDHRDGDDCEDWMLTVAAGDTPSGVLAPYPTLRGHKGDKVVFDARPVTSDSAWKIHLSDDILSIFEAHDFPFSRISLSFSGPSPTESYAMKVETVATHLSIEYGNLSDEEKAGGDVPALLSARLSSVIDLGVEVSHVIIADD